MGWQDRDYSHPWERWESRQSFQHNRPRLPRRSPLVMGLIGAHLMAWVLMLMFQSDASGAGIPQRLAISAESAAPHAILTHPYSTVSPFDVLFTSLLLYLLGAHVVERIGTRAALLTYLAGNLAAGLAGLIVARGAPGLALLPLNSPTGALSAWLMALWLVARFEGVVLGGRFVPARTLISVVFVAATLLMLAFNRAGGAMLACASIGGLAGAPLGASIGRLLASLGRPRLRLRVEEQEPARPRATRRGAAAVRPSVPDRVAEADAPRPGAEPDVQDVPDIDDILEKIRREGRAALTPAEIERLEAATQALQRRSSRR
ncbi:MAG: rhomboid family intramembrane serine protease [Planctomycetia bacterium]|nr:MAG: rhomboid family intramembrane serine protease [Planctomycetia bacterium]